MSGSPRSDDRSSVTSTSHPIVSPAADNSHMQQHQQQQYQQQPMYGMPLSNQSVHVAAAAASAAAAAATAASTATTAVAAVTGSTNQPGQESGFVPTGPYQYQGAYQPTNLQQRVDAAVSSLNQMFPGAMSLDGSSYQRGQSPQGSDGSNSSFSFVPGGQVVTKFQDNPESEQHATAVERTENETRSKGGQSGLGFESQCVHFGHASAGGCQRSTGDPRLILGKGYRLVVLGRYGCTDPLLNKPFYPNGLVVGILTWYQSKGLGFESQCVHFGHPSAGGCQGSTGDPQLILGKGYRLVVLGGYGRTDPLLNKPFYPNVGSDEELTIGAGAVVVASSSVGVAAAAVSAAADVDAVVFVSAAADVDAVALFSAAVVCPRPLGPLTATAALAYCSTMALLRVLAFDHEGRPVNFETWLDDLQLYLLSDIKDGVSLFDHVTAQALYDAVVAHYSSPATTALRRLLLPYRFPELSAFATVEDLVSHLRASDARYRAAIPADFLDKNQPPMFITLYFIVTRLPNSLRSVRDHFLSLDPTSLTVDLLEQHLLAAETSAVAVVAPSYASAAAADISDAEDVGDASASAKGHSGKGKDGKGCGGGSGGGGGGSGSSGGGSSGGGSGGGTGGGSGGSGGGGGGSGGSGGGGGCGTGGGGTGARRVGSGGGQHQQIAIFDLDFDAILSAMYALSVSAEGDYYRCVPPDPGIAADALGASESGTLPNTVPAQALHTFTLDSGAFACFFCDITTLTPLSSPVPVRVADPSRGSVVARSSTILPCLAVPSSSLSGLHLPSFSANLVSTAALQDAMVTTTTPGGQRVSICTCTRTGRHLATFTRRPESSLYTLATEPSQVGASAQVPASGQVATSCSCRLLSHQTLLWHHRLGHPSLPRLRGMHSRLLSRERYFLLVVDDYTRYTTVFPLRSKGQVVDVLIPWIRTVCLQLRERFGQDLPVLRLHSDRGGEFSSNLLRDFCRGEGILQSFTLPDFPQQKGIAESRIGLVMEVARTSMIHAAAPHFLWPFAVWYAAHQLNLWPRVSLPQTSPTLRWTGEVGDASVFRVWGSRAFVLDTSADKLSACAVPCGPAPSGVSQVDPLPGPARIQVAVGSGAASGGAVCGGAEPGGVETGGGEPRGAEPEGVEPGGAASDASGMAAMDAEMASWRSTGTYVDEVPPPGANIVDGMWIFRVKRPPGSPPTFKARYVARGLSQRQGVDYFQTFSPTPKMTTLRVLLHVAAQGDYELHSLDFSTAFLQGRLHEEIWLRRPPGFTESFLAGTQWSLRQPVYGLRQAPHEWHDTLRTTLAALGRAPPFCSTPRRPFAARSPPLAACAPPFAPARHPAAHSPVGRHPAARAALLCAALPLVPPGCCAQPCWPAPSCPRHPTAARPAVRRPALPFVLPFPGHPPLFPSRALPRPALRASLVLACWSRATLLCQLWLLSAYSPLIMRASLYVLLVALLAHPSLRGVPPPPLPPGAGDPGAGGASAGGTRAGGAGAGGAEAGGIGAGGATDSFTERCEPESRLASPVRAVRTGRRVPHPRPPPVRGTHIVALRPSSVPLRVPLPHPPASSLLAVPDPESDLARAASPTVPRLLASVVTDPSFESTAASALVSELVGFATACHIDYATSLVAQSESDYFPSVG
ncbi:unnamed protein product, partial [Closterium sp. NIES-54]